MNEHRFGTCPRCSQIAILVDTEEGMDANLCVRCDADDRAARTPALGIVGVVADDCARYTSFYESLVALEMPDGWTKAFVRGSDRIRGRNRLRADLLRSEFEWLLFVDDDSVFPPDSLRRLLSAVEAEPAAVVAGLYMQRVAPFSPVAYLGEHPDGGLIPVDLRDAQDDVIEVTAAGTGFMLIHRDVLEKVGPFDYRVESEDIMFCRRVWDVGFTVWLDTTVRVGHVAQSVIWPTQANDQWHVGISVAGGLDLLCPLGTDEVVAS